MTMISVSIFIIYLLHSSVARFPTERSARLDMNAPYSFYNKTSNVDLFTRHPHPHLPPPPIPDDNFNISMVAPFPISQNEDEMKVDKLFNEFARIMSQGERIKMTILSRNHTCFTEESTNCYDHLRKVLNEKCVDDTKHPYSMGYKFVLMNMCNAAWLSEEEITNTMQCVCEGAKIS